jgi:hypothetical protein
MIACLHGEEMNRIAKSQAAQIIKRRTGKFRIEGEISVFRAIKKFAVSYDFAARKGLAQK